MSLDRQLYDLLVDRMRELSEVNQRILEFMGASSKDRENIHVRLDKHDERITLLEQEPKKKAQSH